MTTYRERRLRKAERLREWAGKREATAEAAREQTQQLVDSIPMGQPILVGHHSEKRARRDVERIDNGMRKTVENGRKADEFRDRADGIERAAAGAIYSDDPDAVERLREKIAKLEAQREEIKARNAAYRKEHREELKGATAYERDQAMPYPGYVLRNLGGNNTRQRKRLAELEREAARPADDRGTGRMMAARYGGECADCGATVARGDLMTYYRRTREVVCAKCEEAK